MVGVAWKLGCEFQSVKGEDRDCGGLGGVHSVAATMVLLPKGLL